MYFLNPIAVFKVIIRDELWELCKYRGIQKLTKGEENMNNEFFYGKVSDNKDPDELNRVKVTILGKEESVSDWLPVVTPLAGPDNGISILPEVDDIVVVVAMEGSNIKKAVLGSIWFNNAAPPETGENSDGDLNGDGTNSLKFLKSRSGHMIIFDDTDGAEKFQIISSDGKSRFEFDVAGELGNLTSEVDVVISAKGTLTLMAESITIQSEKVIEISGDEYAASAKSAMEITADKDITIKGSGIALN
jgi:uncharacterized protein involved in type VI secretion and phage assembly